MSTLEQIEDRIRDLEMAELKKLEAANFSGEAHLRLSRGDVESVELRHYLAKAEFQVNALPAASASAPAVRQRLGSRKGFCCATEVRGPGLGPWLCAAKLWLQRRDDSLRAVAIDPEVSDHLAHVAELDLIVLWKGAVDLAAIADHPAVGRRAPGRALGAPLEHGLN